MIKAREHLEPEGRWDAARVDFAALYERHELDDDGTLSFPGEYLVVLGRKS